MNREFIPLSDREAMTAALESAEKCASLLSTSIQTLAEYARVRMRNRPELPELLNSIGDIAPGLPAMLNKLAAIDAKVRKALPH